MPEPDPMYVMRSKIDAVCSSCSEPVPIRIALDALFAFRGRVDDLEREVDPEMVVLVYDCPCGEEVQLKAHELHLSDL